MKYVFLAYLGFICFSVVHTLLLGRSKPSSRLQVSATFSTIQKVEAQNRTIGEGHRALLAFFHATEVVQATCADQSIASVF